MERTLLALARRRPAANAPAADPAQALPAVDAVLISHDHYDHLDIDTIVALARTQRAPFVVPLGVGAHLRKWGIPESRIVELDWDESHRVGELTADLHPRPALLRPVFQPQHHAVGVLGDRRAAPPRLLRRRHRLHQELRRNRRGSRPVRSDADAGRRLSPGLAGYPHEPRRRGARPPRHRRRRVRPVGADPLGYVPAGPHPWSEPIERLVAAADPAGVEVAVPRPGQRVNPATSSTIDPWWQL